MARFTKKDFQHHDSSAGFPKSYDPATDFEFGGGVGVDTLASKGYEKSVDVKAAGLEQSHPGGNKNLRYGSTGKRVDQGEP